MLSKRMSPAVRENGEARKLISLAASINPEDNPASLDFQRARAISRRFSLPPTIAAIVAQLAFGEAASCR
jgi:hypothetical protein